MKRYSREKLIRIYIVCAVLGVISFFVAWGVSKVDYNMWQLLILVPFSIVGLPISFCALFLNFKKIIIGMIAPIPIISWFIEGCKGIVYAIKALICIFKHQELVIGEKENKE